MTVTDARDAFATLCRDVFGTGECTEATRSRELERAVKELLIRLQMPDEPRLEGDLDRSAGCRTYVITLRKLLPLIHRQIDFLRFSS
jgi:hypothetical protein